ncbi:MAG: hemerythrin domain-containing protein [Saccharothrix sp.]|nr:hemerythrin domain-containing protein [Saccharothrix sp.]
MCQYCGCQDVPAIDELTREHDDVVELIGEVRAARERGDVDAMAAVVRRIALVLGPHTVVEEQGLFPLLADEFPDHVANLVSEHRHVEAVLAEAGPGTPADPTWPSRLTAALDLLREHILAEQDGVFPAALGRLDAEDWQAVQAVRDRVTPTADNLR